MFFELWIPLPQLEELNNCFGLVTEMEFNKIAYPVKIL